VATPPLLLSNEDSSLVVRSINGNFQPATADQIFAAARQAIDQKMPRGTEFKSPWRVKDYARNKLGGLDHEVFAVFFLDSRHRLIEYVEMFRGTVDCASVYPREVVKEALKHNAAAVLLAHNHPSGATEPSANDRAITLRIKEALNLVDIRVLDHVIVAGTAASTFAERGLL
jgi:DNA repair protein RadC